MLRPAAIFITLTCMPLLPAQAQTVSTDSTDEIDVWRLCPVGGLLPIMEISAVRPANGQVILNADIIDSQSESVSQLSGNVTLLGEKDFVHADTAVYHMDQQRIDLKGNVQYRSDQFEFNADSMTRFVNSENSELADLDFFIPLNHGNGSAEKVIRTDQQITYLYDMSYSTCTPDDRIWHFNAKEMRLDHARGVGLAKHMTLRVKDIPILYFPALSFPIDDRRKSGFLYPTVGQSARHGFEFEIPYYWNIAPQADATLTPRYMRDRGMQLNSEWRYLNSWSETQLDYEYLDDDLYGNRRKLASIQHSGRISRHWSTSLSAAEVSDFDYLRDFGSDLSSTSVTHLSRSASLVGQWDNWKFVSRLLSYQTVDNTIPEDSYPDELLPDLSLNGFYPDIGAGIEYELASSYSIFTRADNISNQRFDIRPRFSRPFGTSGWFVIPALSGQYTSYRLDDPNLPLAQETKISRSVPIASLDSGLIFERAVGENDRFLQTFEPRIFYLNVPFREQDNLPVFDTRETAFGMYQLYEENRYAGIDRIGDANQASLSLTSRWLRRATGEERFRVSLGQIYFFEERRVTLPGQVPDTDEQSGILAEIGASFGKHWSGSLDLEWNPDSEKTDKGLFRVRYNQQNRYVFNLGYRYRRAADLNDINLKQSDISFSLPLSQRWSTVGRWNRSFEEKIDLDKYFGFEYESCCWAFRILGRRFLLGQNASNSPEFDKSIYFEIIFKGLSRAGTNIGQQLEQNITGYKDPFE
ncbi:MAG: LPS assembly protein LptD [Gammaproteobacteria bacterium]|nr:LPS assembly protein LptD [Gammaproteobacteria bacterium]